MKNVIWWIGVKNPDHAEKYGNFEYFEYSKKSWQFWCKRNNCEFVEFSQPVEPDMKEYRINWQKILFVFDELDRRGIDYNQICLVDSSSIIKWNTPNFFELSDNKFCGVRDADNLNWIYQSIQGYKELFDNFELDITRYISSGFMVFNKSHKTLINGLKQFYIDNKDTFIELQDVKVKKGNDQTPINYWLQKHDVEMQQLPLPFKLTHLHRKDMLQYNWQLKENTIPYFIKHGYIWFFNGIPKDQRSDLMKQTWNMIKENYDYIYENVNDILDETQHKDVAKYTTSRKFKKAVLDEFYRPYYKDKIVLELGTSQGRSTKMLSDIFGTVYTVDHDDWNIEQAKKHCQDKTNINFIKHDLYQDEWSFPKPDVVFIDAGHQYHQVKMDIENSLKHFGDVTFIFDDYGLPPGEVRKAILEFVDSGKLKLNRFIGETPETLVHAGGTKFIDKEGCMCNLKEVI